KIPKVQAEDQKSKTRRITEDKFAFRSVIISTILGMVFFVISLLFNTEIVSILSGINVLFDILDIFIRVLAILLFFLFMIISVGNYKEMTGKPSGWKEFILLIILSLGQTLLNYFVFIFTLIGLVLILLYLYLVQEI
ncbi:MAG: hypothetical protein ACFFE4_20490, partial [Candidatus Thorarchaeota archaeon]